MERRAERRVAEPLWRRLGWFGGIWVASVAALALVASILKWAVKTPL